MKILVLNGSAREKSRSRGIANMVKEFLQDQYIDVTFFDVRFDELPLFKGGSESDHSNVKKLRKLADEADGFFLITPEYHNGMSGSLKNALDFLGGDHFRGKPALIAASAGGGKGGINALNNLRLVLRGVYAVVLPEQFVADPHCFDEDFRFSDPEGEERLTAMVDELTKMTALLENRHKVS
jgi:azobenzene reductase